MRFAEAVERIERATSFGELGGDGEATYRAYAKAVHPDAVSDDRTAIATHAFATLSRLYHQRNQRVITGDIADLAAGENGTLTKVPRSPADNDLMEAEADALKILRDKGDPQYRPYAPKLIETYLHEDAERKRRRINVQERLVGFVPLTAVAKKRDPRDTAWIWRRLLVGLGWAHRAGVIHGAVLEEHVLIHPEQHGLALVDWCYSGASVKAIVARQRDAYPPEVLNEKTASPATDIHMATSLMVRLSEDLPKPLRRFADGCLYDAPRMRPQDAWRLLHELDETLHNLYGPRKFRPFTI
ncbi:molecular chaperone DnaJ [Actinoplanes sp. LDG1-06]|uniref:Molecular chaperone DnaJ n=1 Tax=Paractinoplanes ovalisporus TaxID=2810368 RepID=A0ABS2AQV8_9ACTN|nr:molecular chaperone DnaJ [Actinoplanes ovalisporus]MBM2621591.1 molecular chaperone DnaJ [Actinoplanes ovalisporus]